MKDKNEPRPVPARKPGSAAKPTGAPESAGSMKERLLAQRRRDEAAGAPPAAKPTAGSAGRPAPAYSAKRTPVVKPARAGAPAAAGAGATGRGDAARGGARASAVRSGAARVRSDDDSSDVRRRLREPKSRSPIPFIATGVVVLGAAAGGWYYFNQGDAADTDTTAGKGSTVEAASNGAAEGAPAEGAGTTADGAGDGSAGNGDAGDGGAAGTTPPETAEGAGDAGGDGAAAAAADEKPKSAKAGDPESSITIAVTNDPKDKNNPDNVDVTKLSPHGKPPGLDEAAWTQLSEDAKVFLDPDAGAASKRAEKRLEEAGLNAWAAVSNEMLRLDVKFPKDNETGMIAQRFLDRLRGGTTGFAFDWRTPDVSGEPLEAKDQWVNKYTIVNIHEVWRKHLLDPNYFRDKIAKGTVKEAMEGNAPPEGSEIDVDDLDLGDLKSLGDG